MAWETLASAGIGILPDLLGLFAPAGGAPVQFRDPPSHQERGLPRLGMQPQGAPGFAPMLGGMADMALAGIRYGMQPSRDPRPTARARAAQMNMAQRTGQPNAYPSPLAGSRTYDCEPPPLWRW